MAAFTCYFATFQGPGLVELAPEVPTHFIRQTLIDMNVVVEAVEPTRRRLLGEPIIALLLGYDNGVEGIEEVDNVCRCLHA